MGGVARAHEADAVARMEVVGALAVRVLLPSFHEDMKAARYARVEALLVGV